MWLLPPLPHRAAPWELNLGHKIGQSRTHTPHAFHVDAISCLTEHNIRALCTFKDVAGQAIFQRVQRAQIGGSVGNETCDGTLQCAVRMPEICACKVARHALYGMEGVRVPDLEQPLLKPGRTLCTKASVSEWGQYGVSS